MSEHIVLGPCLTRREAAARAGTTLDEVCRRPDLLRLGGRWLEETYFAFQFDGLGVRPDLGRVVMEMRAHHSGVEIADFLVQPNTMLDNTSPLAWLKTGHGPDRVLAVASGR